MSLLQPQLSSALTGEWMLQKTCTSISSRLELLYQLVPYVMVMGMMIWVMNGGFADALEGL